MSAPLGFAVTVSYKEMSFAYRSDKTDAREVLRELADKHDTMYDWLDARITLKRIDK